MLELTAGHVQSVSHTQRQQDEQRTRGRRQTGARQEEEAAVTCQPKSFFSMMMVKVFALFAAMLVLAAAHGTGTQEEGEKKEK